MKFDNINFYSTLPHAETSRLHKNFYINIYKNINKLVRIECPILTALTYSIYHQITDSNVFIFYFLLKLNLDELLENSFIFLINFILGYFFSRWENYSKTNLEEYKNKLNNHWYLMRIKVNRNEINR